MPLTLIVNADDFGLTPGVNEGILACHLAGSVTSTTLMANMQGTEHAAEIARKHPSLGVGLHFNLTLGKPVLPAAKVPSLVDAHGSFVPRRALIQRALLGKLREEEIEAEFRAQLARIQSLGVMPSHLDSHQHVHALPVVFRVVSAAAASANIPLRMIWHWPGRLQGKPLKRVMSERMMRLLTGRCAAMRPARLRSNDGLCSVFDLCAPPESLSEATYLRLLDAYSGGVVELMVHPAMVDDELRTKTQITSVSARENQVLRSPFLREYVGRRGGQMATYAEIK